METGKKILIIEDDTDLLTLLAEALTEAGFTVLSNSNGTEGLLRAEKEHPDLMLIDLDLPGMGGHAVVTQLHENAETSKIPVIIFSNSAEITDVGKAMEEGVLYYLPKSDWELDGVVKKVKEALKIA